jgi:hypothetical protein
MGVQSKQGGVTFFRCHINSISDPPFIVKKFRGTFFEGEENMFHQGSRAI